MIRVAFGVGMDAIGEIEGRDAPDIFEQKRHQREFVLLSDLRVHLCEAFAIIRPVVRGQLNSCHHDLFFSFFTASDDYRHFHERPKDPSAQPVRSTDRQKDRVDIGFEYPRESTQHARSRIAADSAVSCAPRLARLDPDAASTSAGKASARSN